MATAGFFLINNGISKDSEKLGFTWLPAKQATFEGWNLK